MKKLLIILLFIAYDSFSQSLSVFDIDTTAFPTIKAKFYAFDNSGNQILNLSPSDFEITEDGVKRNVTLVSCPAQKPPVPISSVLTIDISSSMSGSGIRYAKEAAKAWVQALPLGQSECAITSFNSNNFFNQDFTTNRNRLLNRIEELTTNDGTDFNAALINPMSGGLLAVEKGKYKRVVILLTDGYASGNETAIIQKANQINAIVFCVTIATPCPTILRNISEQTGGQWFEKITTAEQAREVYLKILKIVQGEELCEIEWVSDISCTSGMKNVEINLKILNIISQINNFIPNRAIARLEFEPYNIYFINKEPGINHDTTITVTARGSDFVVSDIISSNSSFQLTPKNFIMKAGEIKNLTLSFTATDSGYTYTEFDFVNNICPKKYFASGGFRGIKPSKKTLKLTHPNGGEVFVIGSDTIITWEGIPAPDTVSLEYSIDDGVNWDYITKSATGLKFNWENIHKPVSNKCLVRVRQWSGYNKTDSVPQIEWQKCLGGFRGDLAYSILQTNDEGYIVAGTTNSNDGDVIGNHGLADLLIVKLNKKGSTEWQKCLGGGSIDLAYSIQQTEDGGYIVAGYSQSNDGDVTGNHGYLDFWVVKFDPIGSIEWQKSFGGTADDRALTISQTRDYGYIISGWSSSIDGDVTGNHGGYDCWIVKLNNSGDIEWQKCYGGSSHEYAQSIQQTEDGGYIVACNTESTDGDVSGNNAGGDYDYWIVKLNMNGDIEWQKCLGGSYRDVAYSIQQTEDGGYVVAGNTGSIDGDVIGNHGGTDCWIVKFNNSGDIEWQKCLGGSYKDVAHSIQQTEDGGYIVTGSTDDVVIANPGSYDCWIVKINNSGDIEWQKCLGGSDDDYAYSVQQTTDGGYIVAGSTRSKDGDVIGNHGQEDFWIVKLSPEGDVLQQNISDSVFSIVAPVAASTDINMGQVLVNSIKDSVVYNFISNIGSWKFQVDSIYFRGTDASAFSMLAGLPQYEVESGKSNFAEFRFAPTQVRNYQAEIVIITQADTLIQNIYGEGVKEEIAFFGNIIDFGIMEIANYKDTTMVLITNNSTNPVDFSSIAMLGPDKEQFEFVNGNVTPMTLNSGESQTMTIRFNPKYIGRTSGQIGFFHNATGSPATVQLFGAGIGAQISASFDSAYAGEIIDANIKLESGNLAKFAELIVSFDGVFRVENSILAPFNKNDLSKTQNDSVYIKFSGNVNPNNSTLATLKLKAGLGRVEETSIDFENINWYDTDGNLLNYDTEFSSGHFKLLGICREGGTRLVNPNAQAGMMTIAPNPAENKLEISLSLTEKGYTEINIYNVLGEVVQTIFSEDVVQYNTRDISTDLSELSTGQYLIILKTPTYVESSRLMIIK